MRKTEREYIYILVHRVIAIIVALICVIIMIVISAPKSQAVLIDDEGYVESYSDILDSTTCEIVLNFDKEIYSADVLVSFYDENNDYLGNEYSTFYAFDDDEVSERFYVDGEVGYYSVDIINIEMPGLSGEAIIIDTILSLLVMCWLIDSFLLSCKKYNVDGCEIIVFAGFANHYIKANGVKIDEYKTVFKFSPITMNATLENGKVITATVSTTNRIAVKINNRLVKPIKTKYTDIVAEFIKNIGRKQSESRKPKAEENCEEGAKQTIKPENEIKETPEKLDIEKTSEENECEQSMLSKNL